MSTNPKTTASKTTIRFEGYSDDTAWCTWHDDDLYHDDAAAGDLRTFHIVADTEKMAVTMAYGAAANWTIGIGPITDNNAMPSWPMRWSFEKHSAVLEIEVPAGTIISLARASRIIPPSGEQGCHMTQAEIEGELNHEHSGPVTRFVSICRASACVQRGEDPGLVAEALYRTLYGDCDDCLLDGTTFRSDWNTSD